MFVVVCSQQHFTGIAMSAAYSSSKRSLGKLRWREDGEKKAFLHQQSSLSNYHYLYIKITFLRRNYNQKGNEKKKKKRDLILIFMLSHHLINARQVFQPVHKVFTKKFNHEINLITELLNQLVPVVIHQILNQRRFSSTVSFSVLQILLLSRK